MIDYEFTFQTKTGTGDEIVTCKMQYEMDEDGPFAQNIESVIFEGVEVIGLLTDEQYFELEVDGMNMLKASIKDAYERSLEP